MAYVGIGNRQDYVADFQSQNFSGDGSTTAFTLNYEAVTGSIRVAVDNVLQPADGSSYTVNGFTLNFSAAPASGTDNITVLFLGTVRNISSVSDGAIINSKIQDNTIQAVKLAYDYNQYRNTIINGDMNIAQRGTSATGIGNGDNGYHTCDRWKFTEVGTATAEFTQTQSTDVPTGQGFAKSLKMDCTTADTSLASNEIFRIQQHIEGQNLQYLKKGTSNAESLTLSFWVKSNKTGTYTVYFFDNDNTRLNSKSYTIDSASTWEKKTITIAGDTTGTLDNDNNLSLLVSFQLLAGTDYTSGTLQDWGTSDSANFAPGQVNLADSTDNEWYITGVQLEAGTTASDFEFLPYDVNLRRCQRYCHRVQGSSSDEKSLFSGYNSSSTRAQVTAIYPVTMRTEPTVTESELQVSYRGSATDASLSGTSDESEYSINLLVDADSGTPFTTGDGLRCRLDNSDSAFIQFTAEL